MDIIINSAKNEDIQRLDDEEKLKNLLKEILIDEKQEMLPYLMDEAKCIMKEVADLRKYFGGRKSDHRRATAMIREGDSSMRYLGRFPLALINAVEIATGDPYYWKDRKNLRKWQDFLVVDANTI